MALLTPLSVGVLILTSCATAAPVTYDIDPDNSVAEFSVRHLMVNTVTGQFRKVTGTIVYDPANLPGSAIDAKIDASTVNTNQAKRDAHLRSADFFDVAKYPEIHFKSTEFRRVNGQLQIRGDLTMHGITREVVLAVSELDNTGAIATTTINRKDWSLMWNKILEGGGLTVSDEVQITLKIRTTRKATKIAKTANA